MTSTTMSTRDDFSTSEFRLKSRAAETLLTTSAKFLPELVGLSPPLCANGCEFATDSRFLRCCDLLGERVLQVSSPRGRAISDGVGTNQAKGTSMGLELAFENERYSKQEQSYTRQETKGSSQSAISFSLSPTVSRAVLFRGEGQVGRTEPNGVIIKRWQARAPGSQVRWKVIRFSSGTRIEGAGLSFT